MIPLNLDVRQPRPARAASASGRCCSAVGGESEYRNDEMIDNQLRSVLFQVPVSRPAPASTARRCRTASTASSTSARSTSSAAATTACRSTTTCGGRTASRRSRRSPRSPARRPTSSRPGSRGSTIRTASTSSRCATSPAPRSRSTTRGRRPAPSPACAGRTLAARLRALFGTVDTLDAFTGMLSERHVPGTEFGELQLAIWKQPVRGAARRRPLLLPQRPGARRHRARLRHQRAPDARADHRGQHRSDDPRRTSSSCPGAPVRLEQGGGASATVPAALSLTLGRAAELRRRSPGRRRRTTRRPTTATVISTAGDAALNVSGRPPDERGVRAARAARGAAVEGDLERAGVQRHLDRRRSSSTSARRPAADRHLHDGAHVHPVDDRALKRLQRVP